MPDRARIQFVYFDLDDTLLDHRAAERAALRDVCTQFADLFGAYTLDTVHDTYHRINAPLWTAYAAGTIDKASVKEARFRKLLKALGQDVEPHDRVNRYYLERYAAHWQFVPGAQTAYTQIANAYNVGILTNGFQEIQMRKMNNFPTLQREASVVIVSEETGHLKPHPAVFDHAAARANVSPDSILYVGDSYTSDVEGSAQAGWHVAWYVPDGTAHKPVPNGYSFSSWSTLQKHLLGVV